MGLINNRSPQEAFAIDPGYVGKTSKIVLQQRNGAPVLIDAAYPAKTLKHISKLASQVLPDDSFKILTIVAPPHVAPDVTAYRDLLKHALAYDLSHVGDYKCYDMSPNLQGGNKSFSDVIKMLEAVVKLDMIPPIEQSWMYKYIFERCKAQPLISLEDTLRIWYAYDSDGGLARIAKFVSHKLVDAIDAGDIVPAEMEVLRKVCAERPDICDVLKKIKDGKDNRKQGEGTRAFRKTQQKEMVSKRRLSEKIDDAKQGLCALTDGDIARIWGGRYY